MVDWRELNCCWKGRRKGRKEGGMSRNWFLVGTGVVVFVGLLGGHGRWGRVHGAVWWG